MPDLKTIQVVELQPRLPRNVDWPNLTMLQEWEKDGKTNNLHWAGIEFTPPPFARFNFILSNGEKTDFEIGPKNKITVLMFEPEQKIKKVVNYVKEWKEEGQVTLSQEGFALYDDYGKVIAETSIRLPEWGIKEVIIDDNKQIIGF